MDRADIKLSKRLSLVLRHRPESVGVRLDAHGWVSVSDLLAALNQHGTTMTRADLRRVVESNDKQRFELDPLTDRIRAQQGHSLDVDLELEAAIPPAVLYHGTSRRSLASILATGLDRRGRHHVHLSADSATALRIGARRGEAVVLRIDAAAMAAAGTQFWLSGNGVWLTDMVDPRYLSIHDDAAAQ